MALEVPTREIAVLPAAHDVVAERLRQTSPRLPDPAYVHDLIEISDRIAAMLHPDHRSAEELAGYDEDGLPVSW